MQGLLAREGEQLAHQPRRPVGVLLDVHDVLERRVRWAVVGQKKFRKTDNSRQYVVEIMGNSACQLTDGLHLLALCELRLESLLVRGVNGVHDHGRFVTVHGRCCAEIEPSVALGMFAEDQVHGIDVNQSGARVLDGLVQRVAALVGNQLRQR